MARRIDWQKANKPKSTEVVALLPRRRRNRKQKAERRARHNAEINAKQAAEAAVVVRQNTVRREATPAKGD